MTGLAVVCEEAKVDQTALDKRSQYYDPKATQEKPRWFAVTVRFVRDFDKVISIGELREEKALKDMSLLQKGQRLSVMPVTEAEYQYIVQMSKR